MTYHERGCPILNAAQFAAFRVGFPNVEFVGILGGAALQRCEEAKGKRL